MITRVVLTALERSEQVIKKSRFVATAGVITSETEARDFVGRHAVSSANHNCWAWRLGQTYRFNDDGEPIGTAGKPILQAIDGQDLDRIAVVVTRWFGGILLGSGGLVRAYGGTAAMCLREAEKVPLLETASATLTCTFGDAALVYAKLSALPQVQVLQQDFIASGTKLMLSVEQTAADMVTSLVADLTSGRSSVTWDG